MIKLKIHFSSLHYPIVVSVEENANGMNLLKMDLNLAGSDRHT